MTGFSPIGLATLIVAVVTLIGVITVMVRNARTIKGYEDVAESTREIAKKINGELFRDGDDLVVSGNYQNLPTMIRLSHAETTPGVSIEIKVPARFNFSLTPRQAPVIPEGIGVNVPNLSSNFVGRTNSAFEANQLVGSPSARKALAAICVSAKTFVEITPGRMLISDLLIPQNLLERVSLELQSASAISAALETFPGAAERKPIPVKQDRSSWAFRGVLAAGIIVTIAGLAQTAVTASSKPARVAVPEETSSIPHNDALLIPKLKEWRPADDNGFEPEFNSWLQSYGVKPSSELTFSADKSRSRDDKVYFLVNDKGQKRIVALVDHRLAFDGVFDKAVGVAIVPMDSVGKVEWPMSKAPFKEVPGDGLLVVRNLDATDGATLLFFGPNGHISGLPENYKHLDIQQ
jgi:hypothetical protein